MALVKSTKITVPPAKSAGAPVPEKPRAAPRLIPARGGSLEIGQQALLERVAAATEQLARGLAETATAAEELRGSMMQIASGALEASGAAREQLGAVNRIFESMRGAKAEAETLRRRTESVQLLLSETSGQVAASVRSIERGARRQEANAESIRELERRARNIGEITKAVRRIAEQTNLLALNAAIEAARAGTHGRGFAVVADEVRALAENTDRSARDVQRLAEEIQSELQAVVVAIKSAAESSLADARAAATVVETFVTRRADMTTIASASEDVLASVATAEHALGEGRKGAELVASAAEEQSRAAEQAQAAAQQQAKALEHGRVSARALATAAEQLRAGTAGASKPREIGATAEQLSATIQQLSTAASQIMVSVEQIDRGAQQQAAATQQTATAMNQIESSANLSLARSKETTERIDKIVAAMRESRASIEGLVAGAAVAQKDSLENMRTISRLETSCRRVDRIVNTISLTSSQTSMLAVSGAVEAARAGDAGRGFALVSKDINDLAREAAENVEHVTETVRGILDQIGALKSELDRSATAAELEIENNHTVFLALDKIDADLTTLIAAGKVIYEGAETILTSASQAAGGARQIATAAQEARASSREAAAASSQQARGAEDLAAAIEEIASLAEAMKQPHGDD